MSERSELANEVVSTSGVIRVNWLPAGHETLVATAVGEDSADGNRIAQRLSAAG
ncbi:hypothetical protein ABNG03_07375 [Halorubrum sp. RMP-47]|uniref:Uncharacterized protein n=1 Tax=Halorubrum miltondacostae TaxID=3076378 RepID=A0ABD5M7K9_9EURY